MKYEAIALLASLGLAAASPIGKIGYRPPRMLRGREVPQEHSHEQFITTVRASLATNNPDNIEDPIFGLLGSAAAAAGQGSISDVDCLHQATADQAFTNAKAAGDVDGMTAALIYAALERNTAAVGTASVLCTSIAATNPEIAAVSQHQDPASTGAADTNKAITLALAQQIASIGGDPQLALKAGTFAPGTIGDPTARGNSCDTTDDPIGCIETENLLVEDATAAEISSAVAGVAASSVAAASSAGTTATTAAASSVADVATSVAAVTSCPAPVTVTVMMTMAASSVIPISSVAAIATTVAAAASSVATVCSSSSSSSSSSVASAAGSSAAPASGDNVQTFTGALGGIPAPPVIFTAGAARPFAVDGTTDVNSGAAIQRSCSVQHNLCADAANAGTLAGGEAQCETQEAACNALIGTTKKMMTKRAALDFGSCSNPAIDFGIQSDRPGEDAFIAANQADFSHGSALNIGVITGFICQRLGSPCDAAADAIAACTAGQTAAAALTGQAAADAFNEALGLGSGTATANSMVASVASATSVVACA